jgi:hypothetical protein
MIIRKEKIVKLENFELNFQGNLSDINEDNNPYYNLIKETAIKHNIPLQFLRNTKIIHTDTLDITVIFSYNIEIENPNKKLILAYFPFKKKDFYFYAYVNIENVIYKEMISVDELKNDYILNEKSKQIKNQKAEFKFLESLDIDFEKRYLIPLQNLFKEYYNKTYSEKLIKNFLTKNNVKTYIIEEDEESMTDTLPRETLYEMFQYCLNKGELK